eukprot:scaffold68236_cov24-Tisochrysis_lutea.AAC.3
MTNAGHLARHSLHHGLLGCLCTRPRAHSSRHKPPQTFLDSQPTRWSGGGGSSGRKTSHDTPTDSIRLHSVGVRILGTDNNTALWGWPRLLRGARRHSALLESVLDELGILRAGHVLDLSQVADLCVVAFVLHALAALKDVALLDGAARDECVRHVLRADTGALDAAGALNLLILGGGDAAHLHEHAGAYQVDRGIGQVKQAEDGGTALAAELLKHGQALLAGSLLAERTDHRHLLAEGAREKAENELERLEIVAEDELLLSTERVVTHDAEEREQLGRLAHRIGAARGDEDLDAPDGRDEAVLEQLAAVDVGHDRADAQR